MPAERIIMHYDALFHFDNSEPELNIAISNIQNYRKALPDTDFTAVLLVNGPGIKLMGKDSPQAQALQELHEAGVSIRVCNNAMNKFGLTAEWLHPACTIIPAGIVEIVDLQRKGFAYVKP